uniref:Uncharacterized protein n=1 Tax=Chromera velia CCMP2878 TaxID=1169474 RepID=A0A0G4FU91_9ALVE|eukprot:Cvel_3757.t1-p1 / transcript=Cvel_3757.t1 / gene=Cvel_3757 / organism=Chromera_velia_CCMP2878 / gene_product=hypothetical protein / transcript_product=hypothetical protein / location=Cvel_scaffold157:15416-48053(+) / protein_length=4662 / sequence_SO=supercontig / SO=protein_coding / is_pseudo=false
MLIDEAEDVPVRRKKDKGDSNFDGGSEGAGPGSPRKTPEQLQAASLLSKARKKEKQVKELRLKQLKKDVSKAQRQCSNLVPLPFDWHRKSSERSRLGTPWVAMRVSLEPDHEGNAHGPSRLQENAEEEEGDLPPESERSGRRQAPVNFFPIDHLDVDDFLIATPIPIRHESELELEIGEPALVVEVLSSTSMILWMAIQEKEYHDFSKTKGAVLYLYKVLPLQFHHAIVKMTHELTDQKQQTAALNTAAASASSPAPSSSSPLSPKLSFLEAQDRPPTSDEVLARLRQTQLYSPVFVELYNFAAVRARSRQPGSKTSAFTNLELCLERRLEKISKGLPEGVWRKREKGGLFEKVGGWTLEMALPPELTHVPLCDCIEVPEEPEIADACLALTGLFASQGKRVLVLSRSNSTAEEEEEGREEVSASTTATRFCPERAATCLWKVKQLVKLCCDDSDQAPVSTRSIPEDPSAAEVLALRSGQAEPDAESGNRLVSSGGAVVEKTQRRKQFDDLHDAREARFKEESMTIIVKEGMALTMYLKDREDGRNVERAKDAKEFLQAEKLHTARENASKPMAPNLFAIGSWNGNSIEKLRHMEGRWDPGEHGGLHSLPLRARALLFESVVEEMATRAEGFDGRSVSRMDGHVYAFLADIAKKGRLLRILGPCPEWLWSPLSSEGISEETLEFRVQCAAVDGAVRRLFAAVKKRIPDIGSFLTEQEFLKEADLPPPPLVDRVLELQVEERGSSSSSSSSASVPPVSVFVNSVTVVLADLVQALVNICRLLREGEDLFDEQREEKAKLEEEENEKEKKEREEAGNENPNQKRSKGGKNQSTLKKKQNQREAEEACLKKPSEMRREFMEQMMRRITNETDTDGKEKEKDGDAASDPDGDLEVPLRLPEPSMILFKALWETTAVLVAPRSALSSITQDCNPNGKRLFQPDVIILEDAQVVPRDELAGWLAEFPSVERAVVIGFHAGRFPGVTPEDQPWAGLSHPVSRYPLLRLDVEFKGVKLSRPKEEGALMGRLQPAPWHRHTAFKSFLFFDTGYVPTGICTETRGAPGGSNWGEAAIVEELISGFCSLFEHKGNRNDMSEFFLKRSRHRGMSGANLKIGVVTEQQRQAELIRRMLKKSKRNRPSASSPWCFCRNEKGLGVHVEILSPETSLRRGRLFDILIVSTVRSGPLESFHQSSSCKEIFQCMAYTARHSVWVVGDSRSMGKRSARWMSLIDERRAKGHVQSVMTMSPLRERLLKLPSLEPPEDQEGRYVQGGGEDEEARGSSFPSLARDEDEDEGGFVDEHFLPSSFHHAADMTQRGGFPLHLSSHLIEQVIEFEQYGLEPVGGFKESAQKVEWQKALIEAVVKKLENLTRGRMKSVGRGLTEKNRTSSMAFCDDLEVGIHPHTWPQAKRETGKEEESAGSVARVSAGGGTGGDSEDLQVGGSGGSSEGEGAGGAKETSGLLNGVSVAEDKAKADTHGGTGSPSVAVPSSFWKDKEKKGGDDEDPKIPSAAASSDQTASLAPPPGLGAASSSSSSLWQMSSSGGGDLSGRFFFVWSLTVDCDLGRQGVKVWGLTPSVEYGQSLVSRISDSFQVNSSPDLVEELRVMEPVLEGDPDKKGNNETGGGTRSIEKFRSVTLHVQSIGAPQDSRIRHYEQRMVPPFNRYPFVRLGPEFMHAGGFPERPERFTVQSLDIVENAATGGHVLRRKQNAKVIVPSFLNMVDFRRLPFPSRRPLQRLKTELLDFAEQLHLHRCEVEMRETERQREAEEEKGKENDGERIAASGEDGAEGGEEKEAVAGGKKEKRTLKKKKEEREKLTLPSPPAIPRLLRCLPFSLTVSQHHPRAHLKSLLVAGAPSSGKTRILISRLLALDCGAHLAQLAQEKESPPPPDRRYTALFLLPYDTPPEKVEEFQADYLAMREWVMTSDPQGNEDSETDPGGTGTKRAGPSPSDAPFCVKFLSVRTWLLSLQSCLERPLVKGRKRDKGRWGAGHPVVGKDIDLSPELAGLDRSEKGAPTSIDEITFPNFTKEVMDEIRRKVYKKTAKEAYAKQKEKEAGDAKERKETKKSSSLGKSRTDAVSPDPLTTPAFQFASATGGSTYGSASSAWCHVSPGSSEGCGFVQWVLQAAILWKEFQNVILSPHSLEQLGDIYDSDKAHLSRQLYINRCETTSEWHSSNRLDTDTTIPLESPICLTAAKETSALVFRLYERYRDQWKCQTAGPGGHPVMWDRGDLGFVCMLNAALRHRGEASILRWDHLWRPDFIFVDDAEHLTVAERHTIALCLRNPHGLSLAANTLPVASNSSMASLLCSLQEVAEGIGKRGEKVRGGAESSRILHLEVPFYLPCPRVGGRVQNALASRIRCFIRRFDVLPSVFHAEAYAHFASMERMLQGGAGEKLKEFVGKMRERVNKRLRNLLPTLSDEASMSVLATTEVIRDTGLNPALIALPPSWGSLPGGKKKVKVSKETGKVIETAESKELMEEEERRKREADVLAHGLLFSFVRIPSVVASQLSAEFGSDVFAFAHSHKKNALNERTHELDDGKNPPPAPTVGAAWLDDEGNRSSFLDRIRFEIREEYGKQERRQSVLVVCRSADEAGRLCRACGVDAVGAAALRHREVTGASGETAEERVQVVGGCGDSEDDPLIIVQLTNDSVAALSGGAPVRLVGGERAGLRRVPERFDVVILFNFFSHSPSKVSVTSAQSGELSKEVLESVWSDRNLRHLLHPLMTPPVDPLKPSAGSANKAAVTVIERVGFAAVLEDTKFREEFKEAGTSVAQLVRDFRVYSAFQSVCKERVVVLDQVVNNFELFFSTPSDQSSVAFGSWRSFNRRNEGPYSPQINEDGSPLCQTRRLRRDNGESEEMKARAKQRRRESAFIRASKEIRRKAPVDESKAVALRKHVAPLLVGKGRESSFATQGGEPGDLSWASTMGWDGRRSKEDGDDAEISGGIIDLSGDLSEANVSPPEDGKGKGKKGKAAGSSSSKNRSPVLALAGIHLPSVPENTALSSASKDPPSSSRDRPASSHEGGGGGARDRDSRGERDRDGLATGVEGQAEDGLALFCPHKDAQKGANQNLRFDAGMIPGSETFVRAWLSSDFDKDEKSVLPTEAPSNILTTGEEESENEDLYGKEIFKDESFLIPQTDQHEWDLLCGSAEAVIQKTVARAAHENMMDDADGLQDMKSEASSSSEEGSPGPSSSPAKPGGRKKKAKAEDSILRQNLCNPLAPPPPPLSSSRRKTKEEQEADRTRETDAAFRQILKEEGLLDHPRWKDKFLPPELKLAKRQERATEKAHEKAKAEGGKDEDVGSLVVTASVSEGKAKLPISVDSLPSPSDEGGGNFLPAEVDMEEDPEHLLLPLDGRLRKHGRKRFVGMVRSAVALEYSAAERQKYIAFVRDQRRKKAVERASKNKGDRPVASVVNLQDIVTLASPVPGSNLDPNNLPSIEYCFPGTDAKFDYFKICDLHSGLPPPQPPIDPLVPADFESLLGENRKLPVPDNDVFLPRTPEEREMDEDLERSEQPPVLPTACIDSEEEDREIDELVIKHHQGVRAVPRKGFKPSPKTKEELLREEIKRKYQEKFGNRPKRDPSEGIIRILVDDTPKKSKEEKSRPQKEGSAAHEERDREKGGRRRERDDRRRRHGDKDESEEDERRVNDHRERHRDRNAKGERRPRDEWDGEGDSFDRRVRGERRPRDERDDEEEYSDRRVRGERRPRDERDDEEEYSDRRVRGERRPRDEWGGDGDSFDRRVRGERPPPRDEWGGEGDYSDRRVRGERPPPRDEWGGEGDYSDRRVRGERRLPRDEWGGEGDYSDRRVRGERRLPRDEWGGEARQHERERWGGDGRERQAQRNPYSEEDSPPPAQFVDRNSFAAAAVDASPRGSKKNPHQPAVVPVSPRSYQDPYDSPTAPAPLSRTHSPRSFRQHPVLQQRGRPTERGAEAEGTNPPPSFPSYSSKGRGMLVEETQRDDWGGEKFNRGRDEDRDRERGILYKRTPPPPIQTDASGAPPPSLSRHTRMQQERYDAMSTPEETDEWKRLVQEDEDREKFRQTRLQVQSSTPTPRSRDEEDKEGNEKEKEGDRWGPPPGLAAFRRGPTDPGPPPGFSPSPASSREMERPDERGTNSGPAPGCSPSPASSREMERPDERGTNSGPPPGLFGSAYEKADKSPGGLLPHPTPGLPGPPPHRPFPFPEASGERPSVALTGGQQQAVRDPGSFAGGLGRQISAEEDQSPPPGGLSAPSQRSPPPLPPGWAASASMRDAEGRQRREMMEREEQKQQQAFRQQLGSWGMLPGAGPSRQNNNNPNSGGPRSDLPAALHHLVVPPPSSHSVQTQQQQQQSMPPPRIIQQAPSSSSSGPLPMPMMQQQQQGEPRMLPMPMMQGGPSGTSSTAAAPAMPQGMASGWERRQGQGQGERSAGDPGGTAAPGVGAMGMGGRFGGMGGQPQQPRPPPPSFPFPGGSAAAGGGGGAGFGSLKQASAWGAAVTGGGGGYGRGRGGGGGFRRGGRGRGGGGGFSHGGPGGPGFGSAGAQMVGGGGGGFDSQSYSSSRFGLNMGGGYKRSHRGPKPPPREKKESDIMKRMTFGDSSSSSEPGGSSEEEDEGQQQAPKSLREELEENGIEDWIVESIDTASSGPANKEIGLANIPAWLMEKVRLRKREKAMEKFQQHQQQQNQNQQRD